MYFHWGGLLRRALLIRTGPGRRRGDFLGSFLEGDSLWFKKNDGGKSGHIIFRIFRKTAFAPPKRTVK